MNRQPLRVVKLLLDHGADITIANKKGRSPLHYAVRNRHPKVLEFLLDQGIDIERSDSFKITPLFWAATFNAYAGCELLLRRGASVDGRGLAG